MAAQDDQFKNLMSASGPIKALLNAKKKSNSVDVWGLGQHRHKKTGAWSSNLGYASLFSRLCSRDYAPVCTASVP